MERSIILKRVTIKFRGVDKKMSNRTIICAFGTKTKLVQELDLIAKKHGLSRSELIRRGARKIVREYQKEEQLQEVIL